MANTIKLEIVTPDGTFYSESVEKVTLHSLDGRMKIFPHNIPQIAQLAPGKMIVHRDGRKNCLTLGEGIVLVSSDLVNVITDMAVAARKC